MIKDKALKLEKNIISDRKLTEKINKFMSGNKLNKS